MLDYYSDLFQAGDLYGVEECCGMLKRKVTLSMVEELLRPYSREDVIHALHAMNPTKTSGPDGFSALFYKKYWDIVGNDLLSVVLQILNENRDPSDFNYTYISLIPKLPILILPFQFRPISLCNVTMKLVTKCIANRLKSILQHLFMSLKVPLYLAN